MLESALEAGAEDAEFEGEAATIYAAPSEFFAVKAALEAAGYAFLSAETGYVPLNTVPVQDKDDAKRLLNLLATIEEHEDVQSVYANYEMPDEWIAELSGS